MKFFMPSCPIRLSLESLPAKAAPEKMGGLEIAYAFVQTPLGPCLAGVNGSRICYLAFASGGSDPQMLADLSARWPGASLSGSQELLAARIADMFSPRDPAHRTIRLLVRGTSFQVEVWRSLLRIPAGQTRSYIELAKEIGRPKAARAVGSAIAANPIAWLIPCHRVIRSNGQLGGYRWGSVLKKVCLAYEEER